MSAFFFVSSAAALVVDDEKRSEVLWPVVAKANVYGVLRLLPGVGQHSSAIYSRTTHSNDRTDTKLTTPIQLNYRQFPCILSRPTKKAEGPRAG